MAIRDVKEYYYVMTQQYIDLKNDLSEFEQALQNGYVTIDKVNEIKEEIAKLEENKNRLAYIMYLMELPNRKSKQLKYKKQQEKLINYFKDIKADQEAVELENKSITAKIIAELKELTKNK